MCVSLVAFNALRRAGIARKLRPDAWSHCERHIEVNALREEADNEQGFRSPPLCQLSRLTFHTAATARMLDDKIEIRYQLIDGGW